MKKPGSKLRIRSSSTSRLGKYLQPATNDRDLESILAQNKDISQAIIEHSPFGISVRNSKGQLISVNQAWREIWQVPVEIVNEDMATVRTELKFDQTDSYLGEWLPEVEKIYREGGLLTVPEVRIPRVAAKQRQS